MDPIGWFVAFVWEALSILSRFFGVVRATVVAGLGWFVGLLGGWAVVSALMGAAVVLNVLGSEDVYTTLSRVVDRTDTDDRASVEAVREMSSEVMTDDAGRFSPDAFERATGMTPAEFVHLFLKSKGGRVKQRTLTACLPWSRATVSRLLDDLEREGSVERVEVGRENVVCTDGAGSTAGPERSSPDE